MKRLPLLAASALLLVLVGCGSAAYQRVPMPDQNVSVSRADVTRIYVLREEVAGLRVAEIAVFDADTEIGTLDTGTYLCWERAGGRTLGRAFYRSLEPSKGKLEGILDLNCEAGKVYYFNLVVERAYGQPKATALDPEEGRKLVAERRPAPKP